MTRREVQRRLGGRKILCLLLFGFVAACEGGSPPTATAVLALHDVPPRIATVSLAAFRADALTLVESVTVTADVEAIALGLPAEVPLELRAIARTATSASGRGGTPAFAARAFRTVPLSREPVPITLVLRPAGTLDVVVRVDADAREPPGLGLVEAEREAPPRPVPSPGRARFVSVAGEHALEPEVEDGGWRLRGGRGLWVEPERVSVAPATWVRAAAPGTLDGLELSLSISGGRPLVSGSLVEAAAPGVRLEATLGGTDAFGAPLVDPELEVGIEYGGVPVSESAPLTLRGLPARFELALTGTSGRFVMTARAGGRESRVDLDVRPPGVVAGPPAGLQLELLEAERLIDPGARLDVRVVDARGATVRAAVGALDIGGSDPWLRPLDGSSRRLEPSSAGRARFRVLRASAPRVGSVQAIARFVPVRGPALTSTLTLPPL